MTPLETRKRKLGFVISPSRIRHLRAEKELLEGRIKECQQSGDSWTPRKLTDDLWAVNEALSFAMRGVR